MATQMNAMLTGRGFRRSQNIVYLPACDHCSACKPVRLLVNEFTLSKSWKRVIRRNQDLTRISRAPLATGEQFSVLRAYLDGRHAEGGMAEMTVLDYTSMVEQTAVDTLLVEYWADKGGLNERLVACSLTDRLPDGLSMVYSFFDPDEDARSLGTYMILDHIAFAAELKLDYVYLGYWVEGSAKMDYKARFQPLEQWALGQWRPLRPQR